MNTLEQRDLYLRTLQGQGYHEIIMQNCRVLQSPSGLLHPCRTIADLRELAFFALEDETAKRNAVL